MKYTKELCPGLYQGYDEWIPDDEESISLRHVAMMIVQLREAGGNLEAINSSLLPRTKQ